jgi:hypothetical protein
VEYGKKFLIIGNVQVLTYKEVFPSSRPTSCGWVSPSTAATASSAFPTITRLTRLAGESTKMASSTSESRVFAGGRTWIMGRRHENVPLMTMADNLKFSKHKGDQRQGGLQPIR